MQSEFVQYVLNHSSPTSYNYTLVDCQNIHTTSRFKFNEFTNTHIPRSVTARSSPASSTEVARATLPLSPSVSRIWWCRPSSTTIVDLLFSSFRQTFQVPGSTPSRPEQSILSSFLSTRTHVPVRSDLRTKGLLQREFVNLGVKFSIYHHNNSLYPFTLPPLTHHHSGYGFRELQIKIPLLLLSFP